jgi:hypothetical protein
VHNFLNAEHALDIKDLSPILASSFRKKEAMEEDKRIHSNEVYLRIMLNQMPRVRNGLSMVFDESFLNDDLKRQLREHAYTMRKCRTAEIAKTPQGREAIAREKAMHNLRQKRKFVVQIKINVIIV